MKPLIYTFLLLCCFPLSASSSPKPFQAKLVHVYVGPGTSEICRQSWMQRVRIFLRAHGKDSIPMEGFQDFSELIKKIKEETNGLLLVPGGKAFAMGLNFHSALEKARMTQKDFKSLFNVQSWSYLGNCAGAYFAAQSSSAEIVHLDEETKGSFNSRDLKEWKSLSLLSMHLHSLVPYKTALQDVTRAWSGGKALYVSEFDAYSMWIGGPNLNEVKGEALFSDERGNTLAINAQQEGCPPVIIMNIHPEFSDGVLKHVHKTKGYPEEELGKHKPKRETEMVYSILSKLL